MESAIRLTCNLSVPNPFVTSIDLDITLMLASALNIPRRKYSLVTLIDTCRARQIPVAGRYRCEIASILVGSKLARSSDSPVCRTFSPRLPR